jgi:hypothetical protein
MLSVIGPDFEVVKEGRILHLVSGYRRVTLVPVAYSETSSIIDKRFEISNLELKRDNVCIVKIVSE